MAKLEIKGKDRSRHRIIYNVKPHEYAEENKENIREQFCTKYGVDKSLVDVVVNYIDENENVSSCIDPEKISSIQQPEFQRELILKYLQLSGITDYDPEKILQIDSLVNSRVNFDQYEEKTTYKINYIKFDNFLSYGDDNFIDFRDFHGLVLLRGNPANQSGKTTLCNDLVHFALFGKTKTGKADSFAQIFNKFRPEKNEVKVEASITVQNQEYIIIRTLTRPEKKRGKNVTITNSVQYFRKHDGDVLEELEDMDNLKAESVTKTNQALKEAIGNERDFDLMSCINAPNLNEIIYLKDAERSRSMIRWFGLQSIEDKSVIAREIWNKEISKGRYSNIYNRETLASDNLEIKASIEDNNKKIEDDQKNLEECKKRIEGYNRELDILMSSMRKINPDLEKIDYNTLIIELQRLIDEGKISAEKVSALKLQLDGLPSVDFSENEYNLIDNRIKSLISEIAEVKSNIKSLKEHNKILEEGEYCPTCKRKLDNVDNSSAIKENKAQIKSLIDLGVSLDKEKKEKEAILKNMAQARKANEEKNNLELRIAREEVELGNKRNEYKEKRNIKKEIEANKESIEENNKIQNKINISRAYINNENTYLQRLTSDIASLSSENTTKDEKIKENEIIIGVINKEMDDEKHWKIYNNAIGKDGITKMILRESIPLLNAQIQNMLESSEIDFNVVIDMNEKNEILFFLKKGEILAPLASGSGYEQLVSSLVLRTVISQFSMIAKPPFIILDEILGSVSSENLPKIKKLFENISSLYDFVFHITHLEEVVDWHQKVITVRKVNNVSSIKEE